MGNGAIVTNILPADFVLFSFAFEGVSNFFSLVPTKFSVIFMKKASFHQDSYMNWIYL